MRLDRQVLHSRVARRMFALFVLCALLPIAALAVIALFRVTGELTDQSAARLHQASKAVGMSIYERLLFLQAAMQSIEAGLADGAGRAIDPSLARGFERLGIVLPEGTYVPLIGDAAPDSPGTAFAPSPEQRDHLSAGGSIVVHRAKDALAARVFLGRQRMSAEGSFLWGEVEQQYLWGDEGALPPRTELCVLDGRNLPVFCPRAAEGTFLAQAAGGTTANASGRFAWSAAGESYHAGYWSIPLFTFAAPEWTVILSESRRDVLAPIAEFRRSFLLITLLSLWIVLLLSIHQIRKSLVPLKLLQEGTRRIAARDFASRVRVTSGDEFQELALSFNAMASRLGSQFHALSVMSEIDRAILSVLDTGKIVDTVLSRMGDVLPCERVAVSLVDSKDLRRAETYVMGPGGRRSERVALEAEELRALDERVEGLWIRGGRLPSYLAPAAGEGADAWLVLPLRFQRKLAGVIGLGGLAAEECSEEDVEQARQIVDQVAVALSNAHLLEELDELNWGALVALARTIDAKSPWTMGHSERAADLAVSIGRELGLDRTELDHLHRGALLHDIGKIGIPPAILDKPGKLSPEEREIMKEHPRIGARILEPIAAYAPVVPVVLEHHEWFDGSGYPQGLSGEEISFIARIYAVADVFDALFADRPYRGGLAREEVIGYIEERSGVQFDPVVVAAFLRLMSSGEWTKSYPTRQPRSFATLASG